MWLEAVYVGRSGGSDSEYWHRPGVLAVVWGIDSGCGSSVGGDNACEQQWVLRQCMRAAVWADTVHVGSSGNRYSECGHR